MGYTCLPARHHRCGNADLWPDQPRSSADGVQRVQSERTRTGSSGAARETSCPPCQFGAAIRSSRGRRPGRGEPSLAATGQTRPVCSTRKSISCPSRVRQKWIATPQPGGETAGGSRRRPAFQRGRQRVHDPLFFLRKPQEDLPRPEEEPGGKEPELFGGAVEHRFQRPGNPRLRHIRSFLPICRCLPCRPQGWRNPWSLADFKCRATARSDAAA